MSWLKILTPARIIFVERPHVSPTANVRINPKKKRTWFSFSHIFYTEASTRCAPAVMTHIGLGWGRKRGRMIACDRCFEAHTEKDSKSRNKRLPELCVLFSTCTKKLMCSCLVCTLWTPEAVIVPTQAIFITQKFKRRRLLFLRTSLLPQPERNKGRSAQTTPNPWTLQDLGRVDVEEKVHNDGEREGGSEGIVTPQSRM